MDKKKVKKIMLKVFATIAIIAVYTGMFFISISAGFASIIFSVVAGTFAFNCKKLKIEKEFLNTILEHEQDLLSGKVITVSVEDDEVSVFITEQPKIKKRVNKSKKD